MSPLKAVASTVVMIALCSGPSVSASAQGLSASGAGDVEVAPRNTPEIGGDVISGQDDDADERGGEQADGESKGVGNVDAETKFTTDNR